MKSYFLGGVIVAFAWSLYSQETWQGSVTVTLSNDPNAAVGMGTVWVTENRMVCLITSPFCYSYVAVHGPAGPGTNAPQIFFLGGGLCSPDTDSGWGGEFLLTDEQAGELRAGQWYVLLGNDRGQIVFNSLCSFMATNEIQFHGVVDGWNPTNRRPRTLRFGRATFGLTGENFSYEVTMPAQYAPYGAFILYQDPWFSRSDRIIASLGTVDCFPGTRTNPPPDAIDLELLPSCTVRGAVCVPRDLLLSGSCVFFLGPPEYPRTEWVSIVPDDTDHDGVPDYLDHCPNTGANSIVNTTGCSIQDLCPCDGPWRNHADYLHCLMHTTAQLQQEGLITASQRRVILREGMRSNCGNRHERGRH